MSKLSLVSYGSDDAFKVQRERLKSEALAVNRFDKMMIYSENDIEDVRLKRIVEANPKGAGLWAWKPYFICKALDNINEGDLLLYVDLGCSIHNTHLGWQLLNLRRAEGYDLTLYHINQSNKKWIKNSVIKWAHRNEKYWLCFPHITAGVILLRKSRNTKVFIQNWKETCLERVDLLSDVPKEKIHLESKHFVENRYDQAILNALVYDNHNFNFDFRYNLFENKRLFPRAIKMARKWRGYSDVKWDFFKGLIHFIIYYFYRLPRFMFFRSISKIYRT